MVIYGLRNIADAPVRLERYGGYFPRRDSKRGDYAPYAPNLITNALDFVDLCLVYLFLSELETICMRSTQWKLTLNRPIKHPESRTVALVTETDIKKRHIKRYVPN